MLVCSLSHFLPHLPSLCCMADLLSQGRDVYLPRSSGVTSMKMKMKKNKNNNKNKNKLVHACLLPSPLSASPSFLPSLCCMADLLSQGRDVYLPRTSEVTLMKMKMMKKKMKNNNKNNKNKNKLVHACLLPSPLSASPSFLPCAAWLTCFLEGVMSTFPERVGSPR